jgi:CRP/FNR family transcriptional regulator
MKAPQRPGRDVLSLGVPKRLPKGALIFQAGDPAGGFYFLESGVIRVYKTDDQGRELDVARIETGDFVGEAVAFDEGCFPFSAEAAEDSEVRYFEPATVWPAVERVPSVARFFIRLLARKCVLLGGRVESLGLRTVRERLAQYLLQKCPGTCPGVVELAVTKGELARLLGTVGETLSRTLGQMERDGLIEVRGRRIQLKDCLRIRGEIETG